MHGLETRCVHRFWVLGSVDVFKGTKGGSFTSDSLGSRGLGLWGRDCKCTPGFTSCIGQSFTS